MYRRPDYDEALRLRYAEEDAKRDSYVPEAEFSTALGPNPYEHDGGEVIGGYCTVNEWMGGRYEDPDPDPYR